MATIEIIDRKALIQSKYLLENIKYKKPDNDGKMIDMQAEVYHRPNAVAVLLHDAAEQKFLLTRQFRMPTYINGNSSGYLLEACAGLIDEGESPEEAVIREADEELGCKINEPTKVGAVYTSAGGITEYIHLFLAPYQSEQNDAKGGGGLPEEGEAIEIIELSFDEARTMLKDQKLIDAKTVMLLQHYFLFC